MAAAARAGKGVPSCVWGGGGRLVTRGEGGARRAERQQLGLGQAAAHAAQSPGVARRGRGETYTGPPARLSVGASGCTGLRRPGSSHCAPLRSKLLWQPVGNCRRAPCRSGASRLRSLLCCNRTAPRNLGGVVGVADSGRCSEKGGDP